MGGLKTPHTPLEKNKASLWQREDMICLALLGLALFFHGVVWLYLTRGAAPGAQHLSSDTHIYEAWAEVLRTQPLAFFKENAGTPWYWGYPLFLAAAQALGLNATGITLVQLALAAGSVVLLYKAVRNLGAQPAKAAASAAVFALLFDCAQWDYYLLTDSLGLSCAVLCFYAYTAYAARKARGQKAGLRLAGLLASMVLLFLMRANAVSLLLAISLCLVFQNEATRKRNAILFAMVAAAVLAVLLLTRTGGYSLIYRLDYFLRGFQDGTIMEGRTLPGVAAHVGTPRFALDVLVIFLLRLVYFWAPFLREYSGSHIVFGLVQLAPLFAFGFYGAVCVVRRREKAYALPVLASAVYWVVQSLTEVDYVYRYRAPALPYVALLAVYGVWEAARRVREAAEKRKQKRQK